jgi:hypothetical protein
MRARSSFSMLFLGVFTMLAAPIFPGGGQTQAQEAQSRVLDAVANKVILNYQQATCEQLWQKKTTSPPSEEQQKLLTLLRADPQMRAAFINRVAAPIVNKMFDCGMIP